MSFMVSQVFLAAGHVCPRATRLTEVVNISILVTPEALSCTTWLAHIVDTADLMTASGHVYSRGTLRVTVGDGSPCRQAVTSSKSEGRVTTCVGSRDSGKGESCLVSSICNCSSALWHQALLASEFWWWHLCFISPKAGGTCPTAVTVQEGCNTFSQLENWFGGASTLAYFSCSIQGRVDSSRGSPTGMATSSEGTLMDVGGASLGVEVQLPKNPSGRATLPKTVSSENETYWSIILCSSRTDSAKMCGWPGIGDWSFWPSIEEPGCRSQSSFIVPPRVPCKGSSGLVARGNPFGRDNGVPVGQGNDSQCCATHSSVEGAQKRPISFGLVPGHHPHLELSLSPATNFRYLLPTRSILSTFHTLPLGLLQEKGLLGLPHTCQPAPGRTTLHCAPTPVGVPGQIQLYLPIMEGYVLGSWWGCSLVEPCGTSCSAPGPPPPLVPTSGRGTGIWMALSEGLAQPLYLFF